jgi:hypothetical protein
VPNGLGGGPAAIIQTEALPEADAHAEECERPFADEIGFG